MKTCPVCKIDILEHPANRCLDELIVEYIFGYSKLPYPAEPKFQKPTEDGVDCLYHINSYSSRIQAAWEVVDKMQEDNNAILLDNIAEIWDAEFASFGQVAAETAPLAICRAAMLTVDE